MSQKFNIGTPPPQKKHVFMYVYKRTHLFCPFQGPSLLGYFVCKLSNRNLSDGLHPIDASMNDVGCNESNGLMIDVSRFCKQGVAFGDSNC